MEFRGRLAHALKGKPKRRAASAAHAFAWPRLRAPRLLRRAYTFLIDLDIPRGLGSSAAAALLLASVGYGVVRGGHGPEIAANVQDLCDTLANAAGFRIAETALAGERELPRERILADAGVTSRSSLLFFEAADARERLLTNPWIVEATVLKLYPSQLRIEIKERAPFALWQRDGRVTLIASDGTVLENTVPRRFAGLPLVVGKGAEKAAPEFLALLAGHPEIAQQVEASVLVAERRWNMRLKNGLDVLLPENAPAQALRTLVELDRSKKLLTRDIVAVDLRLPDRVTVRQSDAAAAAREEALKAAEKAKKKKGNEA